MTVQELIAELSKYPPSAPVWTKGAGQPYHKHDGEIIGVQYRSIADTVYLDYLED